MRVRVPKLHGRPSPIPGVARTALTRISLLIIICLLCHTIASAEQIRIGLVRTFRQAMQVTISASDGFRIVDTKDNTLRRVSAFDSLTLGDSAEGVKVLDIDREPTCLGESIRIVPLGKDGQMTLSSSARLAARYRGTIEVRSGKGKGLTLINELDLEDYLLGVVAAEMPAHFASEAQKAQAVASRTFAMAAKSKHARSGWDLCDTVCCQAYLGASAERESTSAAVRETRGLILTYNGSPITACYSADCGGHSRAGRDARGQPIPYLPARADISESAGEEYCKGAPTHEWTAVYRESDIRRLLEPTGDGLGAIMGMRICAQDESGRVQEVEISREKSSAKIGSDRLRALLGSGIIKSALFQISRSADGAFVFNGKGSGHGMGLCQYGANGMAAPPHNFDFRRILAHYYPGTILQSISEIAASCAAQAKASPSHSERPAKVSSVSKPSAQHPQPLNTLRLIEPKLNDF